MCWPPYKYPEGITCKLIRYYPGIGYEIECTGTLLPDLFSPRDLIDRAVARGIGGNRPGYNARALGGDRFMVGARMAKLIGFA
jgi:hypothetical protein